MGQTGQVFSRPVSVSSTRRETRWRHLSNMVPVPNPNPETDPNPKSNNKAVRTSAIKYSTITVQRKYVAGDVIDVMFTYVHFCMAVCASRQT